MKRCGAEDLHPDHYWRDDRDEWHFCDGRTTNEAMAGQLTVAELRAALDTEQGGAIVAVQLDDGSYSPLELITDRRAGQPVFMLRLWQPDPVDPPAKCPKCRHPWSEHDQELIGAGKMMLPEYNPHGHEDLYQCNHYEGMGNWCGCEERSRRPTSTP